MANDGQIVFEVTADGSKAIAEIKDITQEIKTETSKWDDAAQKSADNIGNSFGSVLKKITAGLSIAKIGKDLLALGKDAIQAASDLEEVQNVVDVTFGDNASKIEQWAKNAGTQFGLTETQAKRFSSTMGAMLKSSGMAGEEIVSVSTDLAGLAADMASFYNLDFDTAFQKIRSGISGETMPLKELGIDMSVATLNAFALQQGLTKTFDKMSQGEKTMLRYQYLMQATADAQGDFARTSDGYANGLRQLETNLTQLKTTLGTYILPSVSELVGYINELFPQNGTPRNDSLLHKLAEIDIKKDEKIAEIEAIKTLADELLKTLGDIGTDTSGQTQLANLAAGANALDAGSVGNWEAILQALQGIDGLDNLFGDESTGTLEGLAQALAGESISTTKAQAWQTFLSALSNNADAVASLTGKSTDETRAWLEGLAQSASELSPEDAAAWNELMTALLSGVNLDTEGGGKFVDTLTSSFLALGSDSETATKGLAALGYKTEEIEQKQSTWLQTCKELVNTIPGLSSIINTNTGEVKGGIPAIKEYADEWERAQKYQAEIDALSLAEQMYRDNNNLPEMQSDAIIKYAKAIAKMKSDAKELFQGNDSLRYDFLDATTEAIHQLVDAGVTSFDDLSTAFTKGTSKASEGFRELYKESGVFAKYDSYVFSQALSLKGDAQQAFLDFAQAEMLAYMYGKELPEILGEIAERRQRAAEASGKTAEEIEAETAAAQEAAAAMSTLERAATGDAEAMDTVTAAVKGADDALTELADHVEEVRKNVRTSIDNAISGFDKVEPATWKVKDLTKALKDTKAGTDAYEELNKELEKTQSGKVSAARMALNLEGQAQYMDEYLANLETARQKGVSAAVLSELADGSTESFDMLSELAGASDEEITRINEYYARVAEGKKKLEEELTQTQLTADETYQTLQQKAAEAVAALNLGEEAKENTAATIQGIADGINETSGEVAEAVTSILDQLNRLNGFGIDIDLGGFGNIKFTTSTGKTEGSGRFGLDYIPHDDYIARLHEGEKVLTAQEASIYRGLANGAIAGVDLDQLGGVMRDNVQAGGNVYLDGRIVGNVISDRQGRNYKSLQRSGWQA